MAPAMANGRCRMHGGKSTGRPLIHGRYTKVAIARKRKWNTALRELRELVREIKEAGR
jgi:ribosomal protein L19E